MKELSSLRLRCANCNGRDYDMYVMLSAVHVKDFLDGKPLEPYEWARVQEFKPYVPKNI
jgi:hypothetical protein